MRTLRSHPHLTLLLTALLGGLIWRLEVEYHGWRGLKWLEYYHYAVPVGLGLFLVWANFCLRMEIWRRVLLNVLGFLWAGIALIFLQVAMNYTFVYGPSALGILIGTPGWKLTLYYWMTWLIPVLIPLGTALILRLFGFGMRRTYWIAPAVLMYAFWWLSGAILAWVRHIGGADPLHGIKSGLLFTFWMFGTGLVVWGAWDRQRERALLRREPGQASEKP